MGYRACGVRGAYKTHATQTVYNKNVQTRREAAATVSRGGVRGTFLAIEVFEREDRTTTGLDATQLVPSSLKAWMNIGCVGAFSPLQTSTPASSRLFDSSTYRVNIVSRDGAMISRPFYRGNERASRDFRTVTH